MQTFPYPQLHGVPTVSVSVPACNSTQGDGKHAAQASRFELEDGIYNLYVDADQPADYPLPVQTTVQSYNSGKIIPSHAPQFV